MNFGMFGAAAALGISAVGSAIGLAIAGQATIGAWKRCYMNNKPAPFILVAFAGAPLTQTIYGFLLMNAMLASVGRLVSPWCRSRLRSFYCFFSRCTGNRQCRGFRRSC